MWGKNQREEARGRRWIRFWSSTSYVPVYEICILEKQAENRNSPCRMTCVIDRLGNNIFWIDIPRSRYPLGYIKRGMIMYTHNYGRYLCFGMLTALSLSLSLSLSLWLSSTSWGSRKYLSNTPNITVCSEISYV